MFSQRDNEDLNKGKDLIKANFITLQTAKESKYEIMHVVKLLHDAVFLMCAPLAANLSVGK